MSNDSNNDGDRDRHHSGSGSDSDRDRHHSGSGSDSDRDRHHSGSGSDRDNKMFKGKNGRKVQKALEMVEMFCENHDDKERHFGSDSDHSGDDRNHDDRNDDDSNDRNLAGHNEGKADGTATAHDDHSKHDDHSMHDGEKEKEEHRRHEEDRKRNGYRMDNAMHMQHKDNHWLCNQALDIFHTLVTHDHRDGNQRMAKVERMAKVARGGNILAEAFGDFEEMFGGAATLTTTVIAIFAAALF